MNFSMTLFKYLHPYQAAATTVGKHQTYQEVTEKSRVVGKCSMCHMSSTDQFNERSIGFAAISIRHGKKMTGMERMMGYIVS